MNDPIVTVESVSLERSTRRILQNIDLIIPRGKITAIMGPSGCGKTTLLRLISGQLAASSGNITLFGEQLSSLSIWQLAKLRQRMGMLFQNGALFTHLNVFDNVAFPIREHTKLSKELIKTIVLMKLQAVGLRGAAHLFPAELSGGMARRVALARAIALDPELIFYDEPLTGQDPISKGVLVNLIKTINQTMQTTAILVSHDVAETLQIADYIYVIAGGSIIGQGTPNELMAQPSIIVNQFLKGLPDGAVPFHFPAMDYERELGITHE